MCVRAESGLQFRRLETGEKEQNRAKDIIRGWVSYQAAFFAASPHGHTASLFKYRFIAGPRCASGASQDECCYLRRCAQGDTIDDCPLCHTGTLCTAALEQRPKGGLVWGEKLSNELRAGKR